MTSSTTDRLAALRPTDPIDPDGLSDAHRLVTARIAADDVPALADRAPRRRPRAARLALVGVAAAAVAAVPLLVPNPTDSAAFAGWTAVPATLGPDELAAAGDACLALRTDAAAGASGTDLPLNLDGARPVVADRRGATTFAVLSSDAGLQSCLIGPRVRTSVTATDAGGSAFVDGTGSSDGEQVGLGFVGEDTLPGDDGASFVSAGVQNVGSDEPWGFALGRVGGDVAAVEVRLSDGSTLEASVADGVWAAWWPSDETVREVRPTLADGTAGTAAELDRFTVDVRRAGEEPPAEDVVTQVAED